MIRFRKPALNAVIAADLVESMDAQLSVQRLRLSGKSANGMPFSARCHVAGHCLDRRLQELDRDWTIGLVEELDEGYLLGVVDRDEELKFPAYGPRRCPFKSI